MPAKIYVAGTLGTMNDSLMILYKEELEKHFPKSEAVIEWIANDPLPDDEFIKIAKGACVLISQYQPMTDKIYKALKPELKGFVAFGIGYNCANLPVATKNKILVANCPDYCTDEVASHAVALILAMQRRLPNLIDWTRSGKWGGGFKAIMPKKRFEGSTVGLYGYGRIPRRVAKAMLGCNVNVISYDPFVTPEQMKADGVRWVDFDTLAKESDYFSIHVPALPTTINTVNKEVFAKMKPSCVLINTGRGAVVNADDLYEALTTGKIDSAAIDAYQTEPPAGVERKILELKNVLSTPHVGYYSDTAQDDLREKVVAEAVRMVKGERPRNLINKELLD